MISQVEVQLNERIENQQKLINYMKQEFQTKTGREFVMPSHLSILFSPNDQAKTHTEPAQIISVEEYINTLNLPQFLTEEELAEHRKACIKAKKPIQVIKTNFDPKNHYHMVYILDFASFNMSKQLLSVVGERVSEMKNLKSLVLTNNSLDDSYCSVLEKLFLIKGITRYNLSKNRLGNAFINLLSKTIKEEKVFEWLDLSKNSFSHNPTACSTLINALDSAPKLFHICADIQEAKPKDLEKQSNEAKQKEAAAADRGKSRDPKKPKKQDKPAYSSSLVTSLFQLVKNRPNIHSFAPIETKISQDSIKHICYSLESKTHKLTLLNFSYTFIQQNPFKLFCKSLQKNQTLIKLNLSNNGLFDASGQQLIRAIMSNKTLVDINLSKNRLGNSFFFAVAKFLISNSTLITLDVSFNTVGEEATESVIKALVDKNDCLESMGDLQTCQKLNTVTIQKLYKALQMNILSKQFRSSLLKNKNIENIDEQEIYNAHTLAFLEAESRNYKLIERIEVTNGREYDPDNAQPWMIL